MITADPPVCIAGEGLELRSWSPELVEQMAAWSERGFPYHAFDLGHLRDPERASAELARVHRPDQHLHFVACEDGLAVGRVSVNLEDRAGLYLWSVHVPPEHEGRGVCRRMLVALIAWLEREYPGPDVVLTTNTFATRAHHAYAAIGFEVAETRWHYDRQLAEGLWSADLGRRREVQPHMRFHNGRWEVRTYLMVRSSGAPRPPARLAAAMPAG